MPKRAISFAGTKCSAARTMHRFRVGSCQDLGSQFSFDLLSLIVNSNFSISKSVQIIFESSEKILVEFKQHRFDMILGAFKPQLADESH